MVDFSGLLPADVVRPTGLLHTLLLMSPTAIAVLRPLYAEDGETIRDFAWVSLNPAGQRMLTLPACPTESLLTLFPHAQAADGDFPLYRRVFASGELGENRTNYQADGVDGYFVTVAQRYENVLVVNFTDTNDQPRSEVEQALRESQAAEQAARDEAEVQRQRFYDLLMQLPAQVAVHEGPDQVFTLVNPGYQRLAPGRELQGQPIREAWPELVSQGILDMLDHVYQTGEPFIGKELPFQVDFTRTGTFEQVYFNAFFLPLRDAQGQLHGVLDFSYDVTEQVLARQQLQQLNAELEARVQERTQLAEQALATAERERTLLQLILAQSPVAIGVFQGEELRITATNAQMAALWGRTPEQVLNQPFMEAVPELRGQGFDDLMRQVLHTEVPFIGTEIPADVLRGEHVQTHYYNFVYQPLYAADGQVLGAIDVAVEVTEQVLARRQVEQLNQELEVRVQERTEQLRAAQAAAEHERAQLQALLTQAPVAIALLQGEDLRVVSANDLIAELWGYTPAQVVGRPLMEGVPEAQGQGFDDLMRDVMRTQTPFIGKETAAVMLRHGQLQTSYFDYVYHPQVDAEGQVQGLIIVATDMTDQVRSRQQVEQLNAELETRVQARTQEALALQADLLAAAQRQARERDAQRGELQRLFEQAPVAIAVFRGPQYVIELANPSVCALWGRTQAQALGRPLFELLPEVAEQGFKELLDQVRTTGEPFVAHELPAFIDREGRRDTVYWNFVYAPLREADGTIERVTVVATEGTEQVLARQQVQALNEALTTTNGELGASNRQLTRTNVDLDNFIYTASHDLKAPITNIEGLLLALEHELPAAARSGDVSLMLAMMQDATERFRRTIDHLTDLSRLQKEHNPASDAVALAPVVEAVRLDLTPLLTQTQGQLTVSIPEGLTVTFAEKNLRSVVYNLLSNAFKYRHPDRVPEVQLRSWLADDYAALEVQDNGLGLDLAQGQDKLFAMFQRLHTHVEGTGVGLYMVKRILENAGGRIEVTSQLGQGSTFRVYFPR